MRFISALVTIVLFAMCSTAHAFNGHSSIKLPDTSLTRGYHSLPILALIDAQPGDSIALSMACDPRAMNVAGIARTANHIRLCGWSLEGDGTIYLGFVVEREVVSETEILAINIDVLNNDDSVTTLNVLNVRKNGIELSPLSTSNATIRIVNATPIVLKEAEYIGPAFPSASALPSFTCHVSVRGDVVFRVFDVGGRALIEERIQDVQPGSFVFQFSSALFPTLCDGMYTVSMETVAGQYSSPCIILH